MVELMMKLLVEKYGVCRMEKNQQIPFWAIKGQFFSLTRTEDELSLVCRMQDIPQGVICEQDWRLLKIVGPLDFGLIGILAAVSRVLAEAGVSLFAISTYDTDYILIKEKNLAIGLEALRRSDYVIHEE